MYTKLEEKKVFRDPIHKYIHVEYKVIWDLINSRELQRLRRIHQLGPNYLAYPSAEHSRFTHSLGVYEILRRICNENEYVSNALNDYDKLSLMIAGLLHDIGHGPFSHAFESVFNKSHEYYTLLIIKENSDVSTILDKYKDLKENVLNIISKKSNNKILSALLSSQLDADRMDYLLRDSYFTGTTYGHFDLERIIRSIKIIDNKVVLKESGIHTVEDYIIARYHMYWQVYFHPIARSAEGMIELIFKRIKELYDLDNNRFNEYKFLLPLLNNNVLTSKEHYYLDDYNSSYLFQNLINDEDSILSNLCRRFYDRELYKYVDFEEDKIINIKDKNEYSYFIDSSRQKPYHPFTNDSIDNIYIIVGNDIYELSKVSNLVEAIAKGKIKEDKKYFYE